MKQIESFFWGIIAALGALFAEQALMDLISIFSPSQRNISSEYLFSLNYILPLAVIVEETLKYLVISKRIEFISFGRSLILNSYLVGLGFAATETALIYTKGFSPAEFLSLNLAGIILIHILTAGIIGYYTAILNPKKFKTYLKAVGITSAVHLGYNLFVIFKDSYTYIFICALLGILLIINLKNVVLISRRLRVG
jgi:hypothetical protein